MSCLFNTITIRLRVLIILDHVICTVFFLLIINIVDDRARLIPIIYNTDKTRCSSADVCMGAGRRVDHSIPRRRHENPREETVGKRMGVHVEKRPQSK